MARSHRMRCTPICHGYLFVNIRIVEDQDWKMMGLDDYEDQDM